MSLNLEKQLLWTSENLIEIMDLFAVFVGLLTKIIQFYYIFAMKS